MSFSAASGARLTRSTFPITPVVVTDPYVQFTADVHQAYTMENAPGRFEGGSRLAFRTGQRVPQSVVDALFQAATIASVTPATGPTAGGTDVVIEGTNFAGALGVTIGGVAATMVTVVDDTTITCRTPAGTSGAKAVVVQDDAGNVSAAGAFTYA